MSIKRILKENKTYRPITNAKVNAFTEWDDFYNTLVVRIDSIEVPKHLRGQGIGKKEFDNILKWAKKVGASVIIIESEREAMGFWKKLGFDILDQGSKVSTGILKI